MKFTLAPVIVFLVVELSGALPVVKYQTEEPKHLEKENVKPQEASQRTPHELDPYDPDIRTALDEEKRKKLYLLQHYYNKKRELENGVDFNPFKHHEGDPAKLHAAEIAKVDSEMHKLHEELAQIDYHRHELFKQYEMQKKLDEQQKEMGNITMGEEKRKQFHAEQEQQREKLKKHEPLHHPGSKQQLEEAWDQDFNPVTFFMAYDTDSNGAWDENEVKALFLKELDKSYNQGLPGVDPRERHEEMELMREHLFNQTDTNKDGFIDFHEFLKQTEDPEFQRDDGWKGLDEQQIYTEEDYDNYLRDHPIIQPQAAQANAYAAANGVPPHPNAGNYYQVPPAQQQHGDPNLQYHQGQVPHPVQYQNQMPPQQQQYQDHQQMAGQQQQQMSGYQHQQPPQYQQVPAQQQHYQVPQQQQYQMPLQNAPHDQVPLEQQQYQHQVVQQTHQQPQQNIPNQPNLQQQQSQQQQQNVQQQQNINNDQLNGQIPPVVQNVQNHAAAQQQQPQLSQQSPNSVDPEKTHSAPAVVSKDNHV